MSSKLIFEDHNGVFATALDKDMTGEDALGHLYQVAGGSFFDTLHFQKGGVPDNGVNGLTNESLLAILAHRLKFLQEKCPCRENAIAITNVEQALMWLQKRTADRIERGVEGKETP